MRNFVGVAGLITVLCFSAITGFAKTPPASKSGSGTLVIVFKDGHQQSFNLSTIERVEFPTVPITAGEPTPLKSLSPSRGHFVGKWEVGDGSGNNFFITLEENGDAKKSIGVTHGKWVYVDGEARVSWDDGWQDAIRKVGSKYLKFAYGPGKSFTDEPDNVTSAHNTNPHPI